MRYELPEVKLDQQLLRSHSDAAATIIRSKPKSGVYCNEEYSLDAIGRLICSTVDTYSVNRAHEPICLSQTWSCCADWVKEHALLGVDMVDICLHLQRSPTSPLLHPVGVVFCYPSVQRYVLWRLAGGSVPVRSAGR